MLGFYQNIEATKAFGQAEALSVKSLRGFFISKNKEYANVESVFR